MLEIDYLIERNETDDTVYYDPDKLPQKFKNVSYIKGPNSVGKSTLLNILAIAFFAHRMTPKEIERPLLDDIDDLISKDHQKLKFKIKLTNPKTGVTLISEMPDFDSNQVIMKEKKNGSEERFIDYHEFIKEYRLIYDIPEKPTKRIYRILDSIDADLSTKARKIRRFEELVRSEKNKVEKARDPEREARLEEELDQLRKNLKTNQELLGKRKDFLVTLKKFFYSKFYLKYKKKVEKKQKERDSIKQKIDIKGEKKASLPTEVEELINSKEEVIENIQENRNRVANMLINQFPDKVDESRLEYWLELDITEEISNSEEIYNFRDELNIYEGIVESRLEELFEGEQIEEAQFIQRFIEFLERFEDKDFFIPEIEKSIDSYLKTLKSKLDDYRYLIDAEEKCEEIRGILNGIRYDFKNAIRDQKDLDKKIKKNDSLEEDLNRNQEFNELEIKEKILEEAIKKKKSFREKLIEEDIDPEKAKKVYNKLKNSSELAEFRDKSRDRLKLSIQKFEDEVKDIKKRVEDSKELIKLNTSDLEEIKKQESHELINYAEELTELQSSLDNLLSKVDVKFDEYIDRIEKKDEPEPGSLYEKFADRIFTYIAERIKTALYVDKNYTLKKVDLIKKKIITESGKEILLSDMGTGQSQSAYIVGKLSMDDNRKIIAMFDEVGMMDENSLKPVKDRLVNLYEDKKLSLGLIVQKDNREVKVEGLV